METPMNLDSLKRCSSLGIDEFRRRFQAERTPVIISNSFDWKEMKKWDVEYFKEIYKAKTVELDFYSSLIKPEWGTKTLQLPEALDLICNNTNKDTKHYLMQKSIAEEFPELQSDIHPPKYTDKGVNYMTNLWIGEAGINSQPHYDCSDNFLTQIKGRKLVRLFAPSENLNMYPYEIQNSFVKDEKESQITGRISKIHDTDFVSHDEYPNFKKVKCFEGIIYPGDLLYIPCGWWHEIKSLDMSMSVNYWWKMKLYDLSDIQATRWVCSTFFYYPNNKFDEAIYKIFDFHDCYDDIEIAEVALSKHLHCIAAVFLLNYFNKVCDDHAEYKIVKFKNEISKWRQCLDVAKSANNNLINHKTIWNIISTIKK